MSTARVAAHPGLVRDASHRYSWDGGEFVPGITTVLKMLDKSDVLTGWAKRETARAAIRNLNVLSKMVDEGGPENAVNWLKGMPGYQRDQAADLGTRVHSAAETLGRGDVPDVSQAAMPFVEAYLRDFLEGPLLLDGTRLPKPQFHPGYLEFMVYSEEHRYGGTMDAACRIGEDVWLIDYKTGGDKAIGAGLRDFPYTETALQLAAGRFAEFSGRPGDATRHPIPAITRCGVVAITRSMARLIEYQVTPLEFEAFLACRRLWDWVNKRAPEVKAA